MVPTPIVTSHEINKKFAYKKDVPGTFMQLDFTLDITNLDRMLAFRDLLNKASEDVSKEIAVYESSIK